MFQKIVWFQHLIKNSNNINKRTEKIVKFLDFKLCVILLYRNLRLLFQMNETSQCFRIVFFRSRCLVRVVCWLNAVVWVFRPNYVQILRAKILLDQTMFWHYKFDHLLIDRFVWKANFFKLKTLTYYQS